MNVLQVPFLATISIVSSLASASDLIDSATVQAQNIDCINWPREYPAKPIVQFKLVRIKDGLLIKFYVQEDFTRATFISDNQVVYKDSCVELFIDPSGDGTYYNFEFNALGTLLLGFGTDRNKREIALPEITSLVKRLSSLGTNPFDTAQNKSLWQLTLMIPYTAFWHHPALSLEGKQVRANLQKCGDDLPVPHYLTWNPILTPDPDYHRPEYFGLLDFANKQ